MRFTSDFSATAATVLTSSRPRPRPDRRNTTANRLIGFTTDLLGVSGTSLTPSPPRDPARATRLRCSGRVGVRYAQPLYELLQGGARIVSMVLLWLAIRIASVAGSPVRTRPGLRMMSPPPITATLLLAPLLLCPLPPPVK